MKQKFAFRFWPAACAALVIVTAIGLGLWQIQRLHWKENLLATIGKRVHETPVDVLFFPGVDADYRPATVGGDYQNDRDFYLLALSQTGEGGYHVLTPLRLADNRILLVDRGWIPYGRKEKADYAHPRGHVDVGGILRLPEHRLFQSANKPEINEWYSVDLARMGEAAHLKLLPYILEAGDAPNVGGFPVGGQTRIALPNNHLGYALTWFALALIALIIFLLSARQKNSADSTTTGSTT